MEKVMKTIISFCRPMRANILNNEMEFLFVFLLWKYHNHSTSLTLNNLCILSSMISLYLNRYGYLSMELSARNGILLMLLPSWKRLAIWCSLVSGHSASQTHRLVHKMAARASCVQQVGNLTCAICAVYFTSIVHLNWFNFHSVWWVLCVTSWVLWCCWLASGRHIGSINNLLYDPDASFSEEPA